MMTTVRAVMQKPYFPQPSWLPSVEYRDTIYLSRFSTSTDAVLFLTLLCGYNGIDVNKDPDEVINELLSNDEIAMPGGMAFEDKDKLILPSCCCGLEKWKDVYEAVLNKTGVWLGHDPSPTLEYMNDLVRVWSDDYSGVMRKDLIEQEIQSMFFIEYSRNDLIHKLQRIEIDLIDFFRYTLEKELSMVDDNLKEGLFMTYCKWFNIGEG